VTDKARLPGIAPSRLAVRRTATILALLSVISLGLTWLTYAVVRGLESGREFDLHRRWVVSQYVRAGVNPYSLALTALQRTYGPLGGGRLKPRVYAIPQLAVDDPEADTAARSLLAWHGAPEATYPPSADLLLSLSPGMLPEGSVHLAGMIVNLALLVVWTTLLCGWGEQGYSLLGLAATAAIVLAWSPTQAAIFAGQFGILVSVCLFLAFRCLERHDYLAGAWLGLAMLKPSMALPFLIYPLVRGRWRPLLVAAFLHLTAILVQSIRFGVDPWTLMRQWMGVAAYFTQGQFTLPEIISSLRLADTPGGYSIVGGFVLFTFAWCLANRSAKDATLIELLCFVSCLWTYHESYDFVILLVPLARRLVPFVNPARGADSSKTAALLALAQFVGISLAASPLIYGDEVHVAARLVRNAARLLLAVGFVVMLLEVRRSARAMETSGENGLFARRFAGHTEVRLSA
jgi:hypothetical protein